MAVLFRRAAQSVSPSTSQNRRPSQPHSDVCRHRHQHRLCSRGRQHRVAIRAQIRRRCRVRRHRSIVPTRRDDSARVAPRLSASATPLCLLLPPSRLCQHCYRRHCHRFCSPHAHTRRCRARSPTRIDRSTSQLSCRPAPHHPDQLLHARSRDVRRLAQTHIHSCRARRFQHPTTNSARQPCASRASRRTASSAGRKTTRCRRTAARHAAHSSCQ
mmetsp:Transcript_12963/g.22127  ORF Transcript_12963/g.22127 Transcript_12963/m.22127 type:complete len:215 (-) Transcript_12963:1003-1647(-)